MLERLQIQGQREGGQFRLILTTDKPESFVFFCTIETREQIFESIRELAGDPESGFNWTHAKVLLLKFRQLLMGAVDVPSDLAEKIGWGLRDMDEPKMQASHRFQ